MNRGLALRQVRSLVLCGVIACALSFAQVQTKHNNIARLPDEYPDIVELDPFGGCSIFGSVNSGLIEQFIAGGTAGGRAAYNFSKYVGLEVGYNFMVNNVRLVIPIKPGLPTYDFGNQIHYFALNPMINLTQRGSRVQPYLTVGVGPAEFHPTEQAKQHARLPAVDAAYHSANLSDNLQVALNYGGGVKFHLSEHFGLRFDARGFWSRNPTFGLPDFNNGGIYIVSKQHINGFQATMGLVLYLGHGAPPSPPPQCQAAVPLSQPTISVGEGAICQGKPVTLHASLSAPPGDSLTYSWKLNGESQSSTGPDLTFSPNNAGTFTAEVTVTDASAVTPVPQGCAPPPSTRAPVTATTTVEVSDSSLAVLSISANPNALTCRQPNPPNSGPYSAQLTAEASAGICTAGNLSYKWTVSAGTLTGDSTPTATFDTATLNFAGGAAQAQTQTITATVTVTDQNGKTASQSAPITVNCEPIPFVRLDDVVFAKNSARVNNCGKRVLIEDAGRLAGGDYDVVLVGHRDSDESVHLSGGASRTRGHHASVELRLNLDEARALNAAAVLTAGSGRCANVDLSRVKVDWVDTDQTSTPNPALCGTSTHPKPEHGERRGANVSEADKNRRVEVYLVPRGAAMPPAVKKVKPVPESEVKTLECPR